MLVSIGLIKRVQVCVLPKIDRKTIWIDMANSPHVLFFKPIIEELESQGHSVIITVRDFAQTIDLAKDHGFEFEIVGAHGGAGLWKKSWSIISRAAALALFARNHSIDLAIHHNSYAHSIAAFLLGIPCVAFTDYEHQPANHLALRLASKALVPEVFPDEFLKKYGAKPKKVYKYPGLKENVYLAGFKPDSQFLENIGVDCEMILVTLRPPATMALYHRFENPLFEEILDYFANIKNVVMVVIPRSAQQQEALSSMKYENMIIVNKAVDGLNLIYHSDLVISAGGTMNREAALLGVPVYTILKAKIGAGDKYLINSNAMQIADDMNAIEAISLKKRQKSMDLDLSQDGILECIVTEILSTS